MSSSSTNSPFDFPLRVGCRSEQGGYRQNNEDKAFTDEVLGLFMVADGMGGQLAGEKASEMAVEIIPDRIEVGLARGGTSHDELSRVIQNAVIDANKEIMAMSALHIQYQSMGTTVVLGLFRGKTAYLAGIGDSRAYHLRRGKLTQITEDHSLAHALVLHGTISPTEAKTHRFRNILWKYLGSKEACDGPDVKIVPVQPGDRFLLSSDGMTGSVSDEEMLEILQAENDPQRAVEALIDRAIRNDSHDNITCVTVYVD